MTMRHPLYWAVLSTAIGTLACAGSTPSPAASLAPVRDTSIFAPLTLLPMPSPTRLATGASGPHYWQNRADYDLKATLDTSTGTLHGSMVLRYTNHSPKTLDVLWFQMEQNSRRPNAPAGDVIEQFAQVVHGHPISVSLEGHQTEAKVTLAQPLAPGATATLAVTWHFVVPAGQTRMGRSDSLYLIGQWYPRVNVYDDVQGWNLEPYQGDGGQGDFYLDYGDYTLQVTVPAHYIVAATGTLDNPTEVLTPTARTRLAQAVHADTIIHVITAAELSNGTASRTHTGMVTWKFHAKNVRDAVFATSPAYQWDATHWQGILVQAYYLPEGADVWHEAADMARLSIEEYSERWFPYPYPQISVVQGPIWGGMEYPMISFNGISQTNAYFVLTHEVGHNWFPMVVGSNERMHAWMDEGLNTFINTFSAARRYPQGGDQLAQADQMTRGDQARATIEARVTAHGDSRIEIPADSVPDDNEYQYVAYFKPVGVLQLLRRDVLGPARFDQALRTYIRRWANKHPTPQDFFRTMDDAAGHPLDWFWREWFLETPGFDQAIGAVTQTTAGTVTHVTVQYMQQGACGVWPLFLRLQYAHAMERRGTSPMLRRCGVPTAPTTLSRISSHTRWSRSHSTPTSI